MLHFLEFCTLVSVVSFFSISVFKLASITHTDRIETQLLFGSHLFRFIKMKYVSVHLWEFTF